MRRFSCLAQSIELTLSKKYQQGWCFVFGAVGLGTPIIFHVRSNELLDLIANKAIPCLYCNYQAGVVHFDATSGFLRLRTENDSIAIFLCTELNTELARMVYEATR